MEHRTPFLPVLLQACGEFPTRWKVFMGVLQKAKYDLCYDLYLEYARNTKYEKYKSFN